MPETNAEKPRQPRRRPTLDERIETAKGRLAAKEAERDELAAALRSLKASKMNRDRKAAEKVRNHQLILMGVYFEETLREIGEHFINQYITNIAGDIETLEEEIKETEAAKTEKAKKKAKKAAKELADKKIVLERLKKILKEKQDLKALNAQKADQESQDQNQTL